MPLVHRKHFYIICIFTSTLDLLGMGHYTKTDEFSESFQKGGGEVIFISKINNADF